MSVLFIYLLFMPILHHTEWNSNKIGSPTFDDGLESDYLTSNLFEAHGKKKVAQARSELHEMLW